MSDDSEQKQPEWLEVTPDHYRQVRENCTVDVFRTDVGGIYAFTGPNGETGPIGRTKSIGDAKAAADGIGWAP